MGCSSSVVSKNKKPLRPESIPLTKAQKYLLRETWETIELHKTTVGKNTFLSFFEKNPEYQKLFPEFKELTYEELQNAKTIYGHGKRVMKAIENAISALDDSVSFSAYLEELGRRHKARSLKPYLLDAMQTALMQNIKEVLQNEWTEEVAIAWNKLFRFIVDTMIYGLQND